ncbi:fibrinogen-like protein 1 [Oncorhynchus keta]|uniref:fibrinogen-like protein 1 n=1 Tax=Oncorhynchus keta TaxID=8018 RepID=UPI00227A297C|nr:fibrinogen-like protein 1 [Oncorhynchus keta]
MQASVFHGGLSEGRVNRASVTLVVEQSSHAMAGASTIVVLGLLFLTECHSAPVQCGEMVGRLQAEMEHLVRVINDQHHYIQGLHFSQAQKLPQIPQTHLQTGGQYKDCAEIFKDGNSVSGLYMIRPDQAPSSFMVFCDMSDGGGWTVIQRRKDGTESFDRAWVEYKHGFGGSESDGEFWLGNDPLHYLTSQGDYNLKINMEDFDGNQRFAKYKNMKVDDEKNQYKLNLGEYTGNAGIQPSQQSIDLLPSQWAVEQSRGQSTGSQVQSIDLLHYCGDSSQQVSDVGVILHLSTRCESGNLNGHYYNGPYQAVMDDGVVWYTWHGWWYSIKSVVMMIRASDVHPAGSDV